MSNARFILVTLICASPAIMLLDGPILRGLVAGVVAAGVAVAGRTMRTGETEFLISAVAPSAAVATVPALWMLIQLLPFSAMAHPIWASAETALGRPIAGSISIDTGETVTAIGQYLTIAAVALLSAAVAVHRQRAEWILFSLTGASALMALIVITHDLFGLAFLSVGVAPFERSQVIDCIAMGTIISAAAGIRTIERLETRKTSPERSVPVLLLTLTACSATLGICLGALMLGATSGVIVAAGCGLVMLASIVAIRRLGLGIWGITGIAVAATGVVVLLLASQPLLRMNSVPLAFAAAAPASLTATSQRILDDAPLTGTGAGTFAAIAPIYREADEASAASPAAATAAADIAIELGQPMLWLLIAAISTAIFVLFGASLRRGRDSFYPAAGASCLLTFLLLCFVNAGLLGTAAAIVTAATVGLAFAQSKSRTVQR